MAASFGWLQRVILGWKPHPNLPSIHFRDTDGTSNQPIGSNILALLTWITVLGSRSNVLNTMQQQQCGLQHRSLAAMHKGSNQREMLHHIPSIKDSTSATLHYTKKNQSERHSPKCKKKCKQKCRRELEQSSWYNNIRHCPHTIRHKTTKKYWMLRGKHHSIDGTCHLCQALCSHHLQVKQTRLH